MEKNYQKVSASNELRVELHDKLKLTGCEISVNILPAGASVPFVHSHKQNEEIYIVCEGSGKAIIDAEEVDLKKGDFVSVKPSAKRQFFASKDQDLKYLCIQVKENSLEGYTASDAVIC